MLLCREQRNIFHSSYFAFLHFGTMRHVWFINTVVCKDQADDVLQVFSVVRPQVAQKLHIQRCFKCGECQCLGVSAVCTSPDSASLWWEYVCWSQMGLSALIPVGMWRTNNTVKNLSGKICWVFLSFSLCPNSSVLRHKELSHPPHHQRAGCREIAKHRFNFRIGITPTDFWGNWSLKNK